MDSSVLIHARGAVMESHVNIIRLLSFHLPLLSSFSFSPQLPNLLEFFNFLIKNSIPKTVIMVKAGEYTLLDIQKLQSFTSVTRTLG